MLDEPKKFSEEAWKEIGDSLERLDPLKDSSEPTRALIQEHQCLVRNYLSHMVDHIQEVYGLHI